MDFSDYFVTPSQAYSRMEELRRKMEFEGLSEDEKDEYRQLKKIVSELSADFQSDF